VRVPQDVAVVGFDDVEQSRYSVPALTTVAPDKEAIARSAVDRLAARLDAGDAWRAEEIIIGTRLVVRESSGA
jgi:DNA-binding LacI/PurR family transcriptional regulator